MTRRSYLWLIAAAALLCLIATSVPAFLEIYETLPVVRRTTSPTPIDNAGQFYDKNGTPYHMDSAGTETSLAGGGASAAGDSGSIQYNAAGTLNGAEQILVNVNHSGTTSFFGMTNAGATVWAMNWQNYSFVGYYPGGTTEYLKDTTGVTQYDAAGNVLWSTISGFYISGIDAPSANITMKTAVFDTSRSGVSKTGRGQCDVGTEAGSAKGTSGVSLYAVTIGTTFKHEGPGASAYQLPPIISGATYYLRVDDPLGTGVTIYSGVSTQAIYVGSYGGDGVCIPSASAVSGYAITLFAEELSSGASRWWSTLGSSSAVSAIRNRNW